MLSPGPNQLRLCWFFSRSNEGTRPIGLDMHIQHSEGIIHSVCAVSGDEQIKPMPHKLPLIGSGPLKPIWAFLEPISVLYKQDNASKGLSIGMLIGPKPCADSLCKTGVILPMLKRPKTAHVPLDEFFAGIFIQSGSFISAIAVRMRSHMLSIAPIRLRRVVQCKTILSYFKANVKYAGFLALSACAQNPTVGPPEIIHERVYAPVPVTLTAPVEVTLLPGVTYGQALGSLSSALQTCDGNLKAIQSLTPPKPPKEPY